MSKRGLYMWRYALDSSWCLFPCHGSMKLEWSQTGGGGVRKGGRRADFVPLPFGFLTLVFHGRGLSRDRK